LRVFSKFRCAGARSELAVDAKTAARARTLRDCAAPFSLRRARAHDCVLTHPYPLRSSRQAESAEEDIRLRVLQTLPLLLSQTTFANAALLASSLSLAFLFLRDRSAVLKHAATATLQQSVAILFERAEGLLRGGDAGALAAAVKADEEAGSGNGGEAGGPAALLLACRALLQDMVLILGGLPTSWMRRGTAVPRVLAGDLVECVVESRANSFRRITWLLTLHFYLPPPSLPATR
jgi:hypothetical protein